MKKEKERKTSVLLPIVVIGNITCLEGLEPPTYWFVASHSIQLSYWRVLNSDNSVIISYIRRVVNNQSKT